MFRLVLAIGFVTATSLQAQSAVSVDVGVTTISDEYESTSSLLETGVRFGSLKSKRVHPDLRLATFPHALTSGIIVLAADIDATYVIPLWKGTVATPRAGISLVGGAGSGGAAGAPGWNFGVGVVAGLTSPLGVRFDYTHRTYLFAMGDGGSIGTSSFSIGIVWMH